MQNKHIYNMLQRRSHPSPYMAMVCTLLSVDLWCLCVAGWLMLLNSCGIYVQFHAQNESIYT